MQHSIIKLRYDFNNQQQHSCIMVSLSHNSFPPERSRMSSFKQCFFECYNSNVLIKGFQMHFDAFKNVLNIFLFHISILK